MNGTRNDLSDGLRAALGFVAVEPRPAHETAFNWSPLTSRQKEAAPERPLWGRFSWEGREGLSLAASHIDQVLQENKIDVTQEHPCRSGRFYGCRWVEP